MTEIRPPDSARGTSGPEAASPLEHDDQPLGLGKIISKQSHLFVRRRVSVMILMLISLLRHCWEFNHCENMQECGRMCSARSGAVSLLCVCFINGYDWGR
jgi:hypothetical protein